MCAVPFLEHAHPRDTAAGLPKMSQWYPSTHGHTRESAYRRALASTTGNIQCPKREPSYTFDFNNLAHRSVSENAYPVPSCTVPSQDLTIDDKDSLTGDTYSSYELKLAALKARRSSVPVIKSISNKAWLRHPKYISYRERKRKDTDKHGKTIWSEEVENSFQAGKDVDLSIC